ncbi:hypothetical protein GJ744_001068 [Endocarpon pusillum]|uniref:Uncharacterized protein n=1 Tax=Endocarpon pusillum TaxID=364733 RepID=A0A8H7ADV0_9EURO|nr:hypothetical protein GJ744_001068 [Endocarpon pusillum]
MMSSRGWNQARRSSSTQNKTTQNITWPEGGRRASNYSKLSWGFKITAQKIAANKKKVIKVLQAKYDEWKKRNNEALGEIFYGCSTSIQSLIGNYHIAKELWDFLEKSYSSIGMATVDSELFKLEDLSHANMKNVQHLASTINKAKETLIGLGYVTPEAYYIHILFKALGTPYPSLAKEIRQRDIQKLTLSDCIAQA